MSQSISGRLLILAGTLVAAFGIALYSQLGQIGELGLGLAVLNAAAMISFAMTGLGLLSTLTGSVYWARSAPLVQVLVSGTSAGLVVVLLARFVDINIHGPTAMLIFVEMAGAIGSIVVLSIAAIRFVRRRTL